MKINVLGVEYEIVTSEVLPNLDGLCDPTAKKIKICRDFLTGPFNENHHGHDPCFRVWQVLKHEIIHAFHLESGMDTLSKMDNEGVVDWFAYHFDNIEKIFFKLNVCMEYNEIIINQ